MNVRSRFAPSPTGYLHIGGARTALYAWAFARRHGGTFILRIEDTDVERSTPQAVQAILDGMNWLGLDHDEGPFYQMQRMPRYKEVIAQMLAAGTAYHCYTSPEELDAMREARRARGEKPRYDGRWRPEPGKILPAVPASAKRVVRFRNPIGGSVSWVDAVKGKIEIANVITMKNPRCQPPASDRKLKAAPVLNASTRLKNEVITIDSPYTKNFCMRLLVNWSSTITTRLSASQCHQGR